MFPGRSEDAQRRGVGGIPSSLRIQFFPKPANILRLVVDNRKHAAKEEQVARLQRFHISAERGGSGWELNTKVLQPAICTAQLGTLRGYHRPTCAPSSTCSTSPVT